MTIIKGSLECGHRQNAVLLMERSAERARFADPMAQWKFPRIYCNVHSNEVPDLGTRLLYTKAVKIDIVHATES